MKLELYYYEQCPFCRIVLRKIEQLNLKDKISYKNTLENSNSRTELITLTGRTTVPCLVVNDSPMFESQDINQWLESNQSVI